MNYWVFIYRFAWLILVVLLLVGLTCLFVPKCNRVRTLQAQQMKLEEQNTAVEEQIRELQTKQEKFRTDPDFVERVAHESGRVRPDEIVFKFTNEQSRAWE